MGLPPEDIEPDDLFLQLQARPKPSMVFPFPWMVRDSKGREESVGNVRIFVLNDEELGEVFFAVRRWAAEKLKDGVGIIAEMDKDMLGDRRAKEILARAVHRDQMISGTEDADGGPRYKRLFVNADSLRVLTATELELLFGSYLVAQLKFGPTDSSFQDDREVNAWVNRLAEGGANFLLALLQSHQRDALLLSLVQRESTLSSILQTYFEGQKTDSQLSSLLRSLESLHADWHAGIASSTEPAAESTETPSDDDRVITPEEAMAAAREMRKLSRSL
jgi:hypothetical protein